MCHDKKPDGSERPFVKRLALFDVTHLQHEVVDVEKHADPRSENSSIANKTAYVPVRRAFSVTVPRYTRQHWRCRCVG